MDKCVVNFKNLFMRYILVSLLALTTLLSSCIKDKMEEKYTFFRPVYHTRAEVKAAIKNDNNQEIHVPGKIFVKGNYLFLNEYNKGVHVIDFSNPASPVKKGFIHIPGNVDIAVRGNYLYADCYSDLMSIDISDPTNVSLAYYQEGVFPHRIYEAGYMVDTSLVITEWVRVDTTIRSDYQSQGGGAKVFFDMGVLSAQAFSNYASPNSNPGVTNGIGGSLARFALYNDRLYTVSHSDLKVFNTAQPATPTYMATRNFPRGDIETVFPYQDKLFIGSQTGMYVYGLSDPNAPNFLSQVTHIRSCDPVIADGNYAYVTLRGGSFCGGFSNQLDVVDITNITSPVLVKTYLMSSPSGLSKDGNVLMVCDGGEGLKFMDVSSPTQITNLGTLTGLLPLDVIALHGLALVVAYDGVYFVNYNNPSSPVVLSKLTIQN